MRVEGLTKFSKSMNTDLDESVEFLRDLGYINGKRITHDTT